MMLAFLVSYLEEYKSTLQWLNINVKKLQDKNIKRKIKRLFLNLRMEKARQ